MICIYKTFVKIFKNLYLTLWITFLAIDLLGYNIILVILKKYNAFILVDFILSILFLKFFDLFSKILLINKFFYE